MSGDVRIVERMFELWGEERYEDVLSCLDADVVLRPATFDGAEYRGSDGFRALVAEAEAAGRHWRITTSELREHDGRVVVLGRVQTREPGRIVDVPAGWIAQVRDGKVQRVDGFTDHDAALAAAGLSPRRR